MGGVAGGILALGCGDAGGECSGIVDPEVVGEQVDTLGQTVYKDAGRGVAVLAVEAEPLAEDG